MCLQRISDRISYLPATDAPLSSDIGVIRTEERLWLYDVGSTPAAAAVLNAMTGEKHVVLSHFHADHSANLPQIERQALFGGAYTCKKFGGTAVTEPRRFADGVTLFPLPSSHAKGCVGLAYRDYAFVGDALYPMYRGDRAVYNAGQVQALCAALEQLSAEHLLVSHRKPLVQSRAAVLVWLRQLYRSRVGNEPYIDAELQQLGK